MYEQILLWARDQLVDHLKMEREHAASIALEAVRTRNNIVQRRFDMAWALCKEVAALNAEVSADAQLFAADSSSSVHNATDLILDTLHARHYNKFRQLRSQFELTNDVISWYSIGLARLLYRSNFHILLSSAQHHNIANQYARIWRFSSSVLHAVTRKCSDDLRFWVSDTPHGALASRWSEQDMKSLHDYLAEPHDDPPKMFLLSFDKDGATNQFWGELA